MTDRRVYAFLASGLLIEAAALGMGIPSVGWR